VGFVGEFKYLIAKNTIYYLGEKRQCEIHEERGKATMILKISFCMFYSVGFSEFAKVLSFSNLRGKAKDL
jgi:hypothetical protein